MDDSLEIPTAHAPTTPLGDIPPEDDDERSSDEEDGGLDWTKLLPPSARPVIPRRGEKEFEPRAGGGTNLQLHVLDRSRSAMFETLRATRTISSKAISYATWHPDLARTHVTLARGIHFSTMGHSAPRPTTGGTGEEGLAKIQKRLELLPEEAIYLIERGSLFCWKQTDLELGQVPGLSDVGGSPMTVQQAFSEMLGKGDLTMEKFQVYAYLKRLGYAVTRSDPPDPYYPIPPGLAVVKPGFSFLQCLKSIFPLWTSFISRFIGGGFSWWHPVQISRWLHHDKNYGYLFRSLRFMPAGHAIPLKTSEATLKAKASSPYRIFFNIYKPSTSFKKSAPPPPDFHLVVINGRTTPMPTLQELTDLFEVLPDAPPPKPRQRRSPIGAPLPAAAPPPPPPIIPTVEPSFIRKLFPWAFPPIPPAPMARKPNPFVALKSGKKIIVIAVVDAGNISFFRFGQGEFTEWPMV